MVKPDVISLQIRGALVLSERIPLERAVAEVRLENPAMEDAASTTRARVTLTSLGSMPEADQIVFTLRAHAVPGVRYTLVGEVRLAGGDVLRPGDLRTIERISWEYGRQQPVLLPLKRIS